MSDDDLVAQFLAKGGQVKKCPTGEKALDLTDSQWRREVREPGTIQSRQRQADVDREGKWHQAHDAHFVGDHDEAQRILNED